MRSLAIIGEPLLEVSHARGQVFGLTQLGFAGDTLNTAIYLARLGVRVVYVTALGRDPYSDALITAMKMEGICTDLILRHPDRQPGLYGIRTDDRGERSFTYWRGQSAARAFFDLPGADAALDRALESDGCYLSGVTLSLFDASGRARLAQMAQRFRQSGRPVIFDPNYRASGWLSAAAASRAFRAFATTVSLALPSWDDEVQLHGVAEPDVLARHWLELGVAEVVIKRGEEGASWHARGQPALHVGVPETVRPVDTTGAGDSFNAAYLAARAGGQSVEAAMLAGHRLAARVIAWPGAILPAEARGAGAAGPWIRSHAAS